ncbi:hypothetical protein RJ640_024464 [Escallonia rubra]|uniref:H/ACA ribonucleoprotein complex non-core subunit NAF1 n=1 Tax=Escallonia rubra TaxID=112253 RepID=A0AA88UP42_9ASTE|nr:hypothetical protein RJ640_024464 [Escallonia rubra]
MVGFVYDPTTKVEQEPKQEPTQPSLLKNPIDPVDFLDDLSLSFADSFLDFESLRDWIEEKPAPGMADLDAKMGRVDEGGAEIGVLEKSMGQDAFCEAKPAEGPTGDDFKELGNLGSSIEEEMEKVSLIGVSNGLAEVDANGNGNRVDIVGANCDVEKNAEVLSVSGDGLGSNEVVGIDMNAVKSLFTVDESGSKNSGTSSDVDESESDSESESETSSSSSSSSSDDDDDDKEEKEKKNRDKEGENEVEKEEELEERGTDVEEGEIREEEMAAWSEADDEDAVGIVQTGPILSKNELKVLPPVPPVNVALQLNHQTLPVGAVLSILGSQVIVEGLEKHIPLNEGSILWITETRSPLGLVDEIFGPIKNPYYVVRYNSDSEVPAGIQQGTLVSFVPEFVDQILNNSNLYKKGYDASGENDEELSDEMEFSDDEKEAEYRRMQKMTKRGTNDQKTGNMKKDKKKFKNRGANWKNDQPSAIQPPAGGDQPALAQKQQFVPSVADSLNHRNYPSSSGTLQGFAGGAGLVPTFLQPSQPPCFTAPFNGIWTNGIPCQQPQNMGFPTNCMPWLQQNPQLPYQNPQLPYLHPQLPYQMPFPNGMPLQQQFNASQSMPSNFAFPGGQPNFSAGRPFGPWSVPMGQQSGGNQPETVTGLQQPQHAPPYMNMGGDQGVVSSGGRVPPVNPGSNEASQNFNQGRHSNRGRKPYRRGGGRFGGGRGRH